MKCQRTRRAQPRRAGGLNIRAIWLSHHQSKELPAKIQTIKDKSIDRDCGLDEGVLILKKIVRG